MNNVRLPEASELFSEESQTERIISNEEKVLLRKCEDLFGGNCVVKSVRRNKLEAKDNHVYLVDKDTEGKISPAIKDGFNYKIQTSRKKSGIPHILQNQENAYLHRCRGKLICTNQECPVLNRLTVMNQVPMKGEIAEKCRFCYHELRFQNCNGERYVLRSNTSKYVIVKYTQNHSCGSPEVVMDPDIIGELEDLFNNNPELTPSNAYKSLLMRKIGEGKSYQEIINLVHCFTFDHHSKNIKASVKNAMYPGSDDISSLICLRQFLNSTPELGVIIKVVTDSFVCEPCEFTELYYYEDEELLENCQHCGRKMDNKGPIIVITSKSQIKAAYEMSSEDGLFKYSTLYIDNQNGRIVNYNTLNTFFYDFQMQSISSIFTAHSKFEDRNSIIIIFNIFNDMYKKTLNENSSFSPHGFASDSAGGISAALRYLYGENVLHRTCQFHYLYGAHQHCCNAIGNTDSQIRFLKFANVLLDAATPSKFELIYRDFVAWISKNEDRRAKLMPWLKFWYKRKSQWSNAYCPASVGNVNLAEGGQSKYKVNNKLKKLKLYQGVIYEMADSLLYDSRLKAMTRQNYVGKGPSKAILDAREVEEATKRMKDILMDESGLQDLYKYLGIRRTERHPQLPLELSSRYGSIIFPSTLGHKINQFLKSLHV